VRDIPEDFWTSTSDNVRLREVSAISGNPEGTYEVEFRPLAVGTAMETLTLDLGPVLGTFKYDLELVATEGAAEQSLHFRVPLGERSTKTFRFKHFLQEGAAYACSIEDPLFFEVQPKVDCPAADGWTGSRASVEVTFEPERLGKVRDVLTVRHEFGGEFKCTLTGECTPPLPRGPVPLGAGKSEAVTFKNVFNEERTFAFTVDSPAFSVDATTKTISRGGEVKVNVSQAAGTPADACGKLLISCDEIPGLPPWTIYLGAGP
jgi:hydrocephalus-inducing protein